MTAVVQEGTNSVEAFLSIKHQTQHGNITYSCKVFLDDIGIKGPRRQSNERRCCLGIWRVVMEHKTNLDHVLADLERVGNTIPDLKSLRCQPAITIVRFLCNEKVRLPDSQKVEKLVK